MTTDRLVPSSFAAQPPTPPPKPNLATMSEEDLAKSIKEKISAVLTSFQRSVTHAMEVGDLLIEAKSRVGHGNFEAWCETHCQLSLRTARRYMGMAKDRTQIEARLAAKTANLADLNAQRLLTYQPPPDSDEGSGGEDAGGGSPTRTPAGDYDKLEEKLLKKLKELPSTDARDHAEKTIAALNDTVEDIETKSAERMARTKTSKHAAVRQPSQA